MSFKFHTIKDLETRFGTIHKVDHHNKWIVVWFEAIDNVKSGIRLKIRNF